MTVQVFIRSCFFLILPRATAALSLLPVLSRSGYRDLKLCNPHELWWWSRRSASHKALRRDRLVFRIDPARAAFVPLGTLSADRILLYARALGAYGSSPIPQSGGDTLCVAPHNFVIAAPSSAAAGRRLRRSRKYTRRQTTTVHTGCLSREDSEYDDEQARLAGIQRLW